MHEAARLLGQPAAVPRLAGPRALAAVAPVAGGSQTSIIELASKLGRLMSVAAEPVHAPARDGEVRLSQGDAAHAHRRLGWRPQWQLDAGLQACVDAFPAAEELPVRT